MSQHDMDLANATGAAFRADANLALAALVQNNSGASAPTTTFAYMWWADTTSGILKQRNAANSAWINILTMSTGAAAIADSASSSATGTTQAINDGSTKLATTAYADRMKKVETSASTTTIAATDAGKCIHATAGVTIPNSTMAADDVVSIYNNSASSITLTASIATLYQAGTANTGNRTLAQRGLCTIRFISSTVAVISGAGLT